jgi:putative PIN family toxin of toxin-antitoxin system
MNANTAANRVRAVLDTNLFVSGLIREGSSPDQVVRTWERGIFDLVTSPALTAEVAAVLRRSAFHERYHPDSRRIAAILAALGVAEQVVLTGDLRVRSREPGDDKLLVCAIGGNADYLVTGDHDLLVLAGDPPLGALQIVTPADFLRLLDARAADNPQGQAEHA